MIVVVFLLVALVLVCFMGMVTETSWILRTTTTTGSTITGSSSTSSESSTTSTSTSTSTTSSTATALIDNMGIDMDMDIDIVVEEEEEQQFQSMIDDIEARTTTSTSSNTVGAAGMTSAETVPMTTPMTMTTKQLVLQQQQEEARKFVSDRRAAYESQGLDYHWTLRGVGYLYTTHNLVLAAVLQQQLTNTNNTNTIKDDDQEEDDNHNSNHTTTTAGGTSTVTAIRTEMAVGSRQEILIYNVGAADTVAVGGPLSSSMSSSLSKFQECDKLTLWVRVNGPEIFAGSAVAVADADAGTNAGTDNADASSSCHWSFAFDLAVPGEYEVDVKMLVWNGDAPIIQRGGSGSGTSSSSNPDDGKGKGEREQEGTPTEEWKDEVQCDYEAGLLPDVVEVKASSSYNFTTPRLHGGFQGFKMYRAPNMCCEVCSRTPHCLEWGTPFSNIISAGAYRNGCDLVFDDDGGSTPASVIPVSTLWPNNTNTAATATPATVGTRPSGGTGGTGDIGIGIGSNSTITATGTNKKQRTGRRRVQQQQFLWSSTQPTTQRRTVPRRRRLKNTVEPFHGTRHNHETSYFCGCGWSFWFTLDYPCVSGDLDDRVYTPPSTSRFWAIALPRPRHVNNVNVNIINPQAAAVAAGDGDMEIGTATITITNTITDPTTHDDNDDDAAKTKTTELPWCTWEDEAVIQQGRTNSSPQAGGRWVRYVLPSSMKHDIHTTTVVHIYCSVRSCWLGLAWLVLAILAFLYYVSCKCDLSPPYHSHHILLYIVIHSSIHTASM
jgi:hypothetical protein